MSTPARAPGRSRTCSRWSGCRSARRGSGSSTRSRRRRRPSRRPSPRIRPGEADAGGRGRRTRRRQPPRPARRAQCAMGSYATLPARFRHSKRPLPWYARPENLITTGERLTGCDGQDGPMTGPDEAHLVRRVARGDLAAFDELYRRTSPWLLVRLRRRCSDDELVAEVLQDTYLAVWRAAGAFAGAGVDGSAVGWLWTIAARRLVDAVRRRSREAQAPPPALAPPAVPAAEDHVLDSIVDDPIGSALRRLA